MFKNTKIITTIGPATHSEEGIYSLFQNGMTTVRMNFSHGDHDEQYERVAWTRKIIDNIKKPISLMLDTKGPEIRVFDMENDKALIEAHSHVTIVTDKKVKGNANTFSVTDSTGKYDMSKDVKEGMWILVDDGKLKLKVNAVHDGYIETTAFNSHLVKTNKRLNVPGAHYTMPFLSDKDRNDIANFAAKYKMDYIAASFANKKEHIQEIKDILKEHNAESVQIIAKIETQQACNNIKEIVEISDAIMVARGDLGLEIPYYDVPFWQKRIVKECRKQGKPVIIATQMLDSMEKNPAPTRAEVTDVYYASEMKSDATMLSGESAAGDFPALACATMGTITHKAETVISYDSPLKYALDENAINSNYRKLVKGIAEASLNDHEIKGVVVRSNDKELYRSFATAHTRAPVFGVTSDKLLYTSFGISFGTYLNLEENYLDFKKLVNSYGITNGKVIVVDPDLETFNIATL